MKNTVYGYYRVSTPKQNEQRQIDNIMVAYPSAVMYGDKYTGTTTDRPDWNRLYKRLESGDTVVFDEVSRMSRNAEEGFNLYEELFKRGINLIFLKEHHIDTDVYKQALQNSVSMTGTDVDCILEGINKYLMILAKRQIEIAFQSAQHEVDYLHKRTSEGVRKAQAAGKQVGRAAGSTVETKKSRDMKQRIRKMSKDFDGNMTDKEIIEVLKIARNTYYRYKKAIR